MMVNPSEREIMLSDKCIGWYTYKDGKRVLKDNAPEDVRKADQEIRILRKKNNPFGFES